MQKFCPPMLLMLFLCSCQELTFDVKEKDVDFCKYFRVDPPRYDSSDKLASLPYPEVIKAYDRPSRFINKHFHRFQYIMFNNLDSLNEKMIGITKGSRDSIALNQRFCSLLNNDAKFRNYFNLLANVKQASPKPVYSQAEMMMIGSRFFAFGKRTATDTSFSAKVCIVGTGQRDFKNEKDYAVLEAFCFEAVAASLGKTWDIFIGYGQQLAAEGKNDSDHNKYLWKVRHGTFKKMENDPVLKTALMDHYEKNKNNIGFIIQ